MKLYIMLIILLQFTAGDGSGAERDGGTTGQQDSKVHHFSGEGVRGTTLISASISPAEVGQGRKSREERPLEVACLSYWVDGKGL